jgi:shikimate kinase
MKKANHKNIFLVGPMGAGKSSVGKYLSKQLGMDFYDTDEEIEIRTGGDLGWIFDVEGEEGFRKREAAVLADLAKHANVVVATGGGTIITPENRAIIGAMGWVVYLEVTLPLQPMRVVNDSRRPLLRVKNRDEIIAKLHEEREPHYEALADFRVPTDHRSVRSVAEDIMTWLQSLPK